MHCHSQVNVLQYKINEYKTADDVIVFYEENFTFYFIYSCSISYIPRLNLNENIEDAVLYTLFNRHKNIESKGVLSIQEQALKL